MGLFTVIYCRDVSAPKSNYIKRLTKRFGHSPLLQLFHQVTSPSLFKATMLLINTLDATTIDL